MKLPHVGDTITVRGQQARIVKLYPLGTLDATTSDGRTFRVTGLPFTLCQSCGGAKPYTESCICFDNNCQ